MLQNINVNTKKDLIVKLIPILNNNILKNLLSFFKDNNIKYTTTKKYILIDFNVINDNIINEIFNFILSY